MQAVVQHLLVITAVWLLSSMKDAVLGWALDVLGTVLAASVESDIVIHIHLSQLLLVQWCHFPAI